VLGAEVGATRPVVQAGWVSADRQVGQSGKTVRPKLYIAAGISGAVQHRVGMEGADVIVAINQDANAPIFDFATGIVSNACSLPAPTAAFRQQLATAGGGGAQYERKFDAIVIGAGPSGNAAAYTMAKAGLKVLQIERGEYPGSKNVQGAILYSKALEEIIPDFRDDAPLERHVIEQQMWVLDDASYVGSTYRSAEFNQEPYNRYTIIRAQFDKWFSRRCRPAPGDLRDHERGRQRQGGRRATAGAAPVRRRGDLADGSTPAGRRPASDGIRPKWRWR
jgi:hypothetical protein